MIEEKLREAFESDELLWLLPACDGIIRALMPHIDAAIDACVNEEREGNARVAEDFFKYSEIGRQVAQAIRSGRGRELISEVIRSYVETEREACAKMCEDAESDGEWYMQVFAENLAEEIRARSASPP